METVEVDEGTVCLRADQKKLKDEYKDPNMLPKVNKSDMAGMMEFIKEYLRSCHRVVKTPLACIISKSITVQTYGEYPMYATPDNQMINRMLHLPPDKNRLLLEKDVQKAQDCTTEYKIDNRTVYDVKGSDLKVKQHKSKRDSRGMFYAIHSRWLGPNHVNVTGIGRRM